MWHFSSRYKKLRSQVKNALCTCPRIECPHLITSFNCLKHCKYDMGVSDHRRYHIRVWTVIDSNHCRHITACCAVLHVDSDKGYLQENNELYEKI